MSTTAIPTKLSPSQEPPEKEGSTRLGPSHGSAVSKRSFFGFGKKKEREREKVTEQEKDVEKSDDGSSLPSDSVPNSEPVSSESTVQRDRKISDKAPQLPQLTKIPPMSTNPPSIVTKASTSSRTHSPPTSPVRSLGSSSSPPLVPRPMTAGFGSASPPRLSTSSSQIFERNVQEHLSNHSFLPPASPAIPAHIQTDNHIPPVLEASSIAITDRDCGVDEVEIVMHSMHQPAVSVVAPRPTSSAGFEYSRHGSPLVSDTIDDSAAYSGDETSFYGSGIGAAAAADKRRLSFISFADVVQAEQADYPPVNFSPKNGSPASVPMDQMVSTTITEAMRRSPSPIRSLSASPPRNPGSSFGTMGNPDRNISGRPINSRSPGTSSPPRSHDTYGHERGELTIETMRQALRRTGSSDFSIGRSPLPSPTSTAMRIGTAPQPIKKKGEP
ncbi:hypothetical protein RUND412_005054 [Rhizina undulata]